MNYREILAKCESKEMGAVVDAAITTLFERDRQLLELDAHERTIAARLAVHLAPHFPCLDVDVEYNRMGDAPKEVTWRHEPEFVYPDIIVRRRNTNTNLLAIEIKKSTGGSTDDDVLKLRGYRGELGYLHALFIRFNVEKNAGTISECMWI